MEMKALIAMFSLLLVLVILGYKSQSKDENQLDNFHRLATISGCLNKLLAEDMPRSCKEFKLKEESRPLWIATENYLTCRQKAGFDSKCSTVHEEARWRCDRSLLRLQIMNTMKAACCSQQNVKEKSTGARIRSTRGLQHLIREVEEISIRIENEIYGETEPSIIRDEKAWRDGIYRRFTQTELLMKQWVEEFNQFSPKNDEQIQKEFANLILKLQNWFEGISTRTDKVPRGEVRGTFLQDIMEMKRHNGKLIERLQTVYTVDYIHSSGKDTSMTASQNIERVFTIPLEIQDVLDDLVTFIQKVYIPAVSAACQSGESLVNVPDKEPAINQIHVGRSPSWKAVMYISLLSVVIIVVEYVCSSILDKLLAVGEIHFGTKPLSPKGTVAEQKFLDVHTLKTVETFFSR